ncbi:10859_t:CDS:2, partial [Entrophospora sp. SA101]
MAVLESKDLTSLSRNKPQTVLVAYSHSIYSNNQASYRNNETIQKESETVSSNKEYKSIN